VEKICDLGLFDFFGLFPNLRRGLFDRVDLDVAMFTLPAPRPPLPKVLLEEGLPNPFPLLDPFFPLPHFGGVAAAVEGGRSYPFT